MTTAYWFAVHARITHRMGALGVSAKSLSDQAAVSRSTLSRRFVDPSTFYLDELERIASVLEVEPGWLWLGDAAGERSIV